MESLDKDRKFLTQGNVFTDDQIDAYIALKYEEIHNFEHTPHQSSFKCIIAARMNKIFIIILFSFVTISSFAAGHITKVQKENAIECLGHYTIPLYCQQIQLK